MNVKFLGEFKLDSIIDFDTYQQDDEGRGEAFDYVEYISIFKNVEDEDDYYESELFMRSSLNVEEIGEIHGVYGETNNSSIVLQYDEDDCEVVKLWRIY